MTVSFDAREGPELAAAKKAAYVEEYGLAWRRRAGIFSRVKKRRSSRWPQAVGFRYHFDAVSGTNLRTSARSWY